MSGIMFTPVSCKVDDQCGECFTAEKDFKPEYVEDYSVIFNDKDKYYCIKCEEIVKSPVKQLYCGHSMCGSCLADLLQSSGEKTATRCPGNEDYCSKTDLLKSGHVVPAFHVEKRLKKMSGTLRNELQLHRGSIKRANNKPTSIADKKAAKDVGSETMRSSEQLASGTFRRKQIWGQKMNHLLFSVQFFVFVSLLCVCSMLGFKIINLAGKSPTIQNAHRAQFDRITKMIAQQLHRDLSDDSRELTMLDSETPVTLEKHQKTLIIDSLKTTLVLENVDSETLNDSEEYLLPNDQTTLLLDNYLLSNNQTTLVSENVDSETLNDPVEYLNLATTHGILDSETSTDLEKHQTTLIIDPLKTTLVSKNVDSETLNIPKEYLKRSERSRNQTFTTEELQVKRNRNLNNFSTAVKSDEDRSRFPRNIVFYTSFSLFEGINVTNRKSETTVTVIMMYPPTATAPKKKNLCVAGKISNNRERKSRASNQRIGLLSEKHDYEPFM